jgi:hypothetical protein
MRLRTTLKSLAAKRSFYEEQINYYNQYVKTCLDNLAAKRLVARDSIVERRFCITLGSRAVVYRLYVALNSWTYDVMPLSQEVNAEDASKDNRQIQCRAIV